MSPVGKYNALFAALLVLLPMSVYAPRPSIGAYPAQITLSGELTLTSFEVQPAVVLRISASFASLVPSIIPKGEYLGVGFRGLAVGPDERGFIKFDGLLTFKLPNDKQISFWVKFVVEKPAEEDVPEGTYGAQGVVSVEISGFVLPPEEITWILMKGNVSEYTNTTDGESSKVFGQLIAHAKIDESKEWAKVNSVFSTELTPTKETEGFSHSFYVVTLASVELIEQDGGLTITGTWNVCMRTVNVNKVEGDETLFTKSLTPIVEGARGALDAKFAPSENPWQTEGNFTLTIETFGKINGNVVFFHMKFARPFEIGIPLADFNNDRKVDILDLIRIANAYKTELGSPRYNLYFDIAPGGEPDSPYGADFEINISDLVRAATELGQEY